MFKQAFYSLFLKGSIKITKQGNYKSRLFKEIPRGSDKGYVMKSTR